MGYTPVTFGAKRSPVSQNGREPSQRCTLFRGAVHPEIGPSERSLWSSQFCCFPFAGAERGFVPACIRKRLGINSKHWATSAAAACWVLPHIVSKRREEFRRSFSPGPGEFEPPWREIQGGMNTGLRDVVNAQCFPPFWRWPISIPLYTNLSPSFLSLHCGRLDRKL